MENGKCKMENGKCKMKNDELKIKIKIKIVNHNNTKLRTIT